MTLLSDPTMWRLYINSFQEINIGRLSTQTSPYKSSETSTYRVTIMGSVQNSKKYHLKKTGVYNGRNSVYVTITMSPNNINSVSFILFSVFVLRLGYVVS